MDLWKMSENKDCNECTFKTVKVKRCFINTFQFNLISL